MNARFLDLDQPDDRAEFDRAFDALAAHWGGDREDLHPQYLEVWQYMGTEQNRGLWLHLFRHRMHPRTNRREYWQMPASATWCEAHGLNLAASSWSVSRNLYRRATA